MRKISHYLNVTNPSIIPLIPFFWFFKLSWKLKPPSWITNHDLLSWSLCRELLFIFLSKAQILILAEMLGMIHIWRPWKLSIFLDPHSPCQNPPPLPWTSSFKRTPIPPSPPSPLPFPNDNQSIKKKHNPRMTIYVIRSFL